MRRKAMMIAIVLCTLATAPACARGSVGVHIHQGPIHFVHVRNTLAGWRRADRAEDKQTGDRSDLKPRAARRTRVLLFGIPAAPIFTHTSTIGGTQP